MWMTPLSWEHWIERYLAAATRCTPRRGPAWTADIEQLRRDPAPLRGLGVKEIVDTTTAIIRGLDRPPIIIGHSFGGILTQLCSTAASAPPAPRPARARRRAC